MVWPHKEFASVFYLLNYLSVFFFKIIFNIPETVILFSPPPPPVGEFYVFGLIHALPLFPNKSLGAQFFETFSLKAWPIF